MILEMLENDFDTGEVLMKDNFKTSLIKKRVDILSMLDEKIVDIFLSIGIGAHLQGYQYLKESIKLVIKNPESINSVTKQLYPKVAEIFSTTACRVERGIRHALDVAYAKGKIVQLNKIFGIEIFTKEEKPTNSEFIAILSDKLSLELK